MPHHHHHLRCAATILLASTAFVGGCAARAVPAHQVAGNAAASTTTEPGIPAPRPPASRPDLGTSTSPAHSNVKVTINAVTASPDRVLTVVWTITNNTADDLDLGAFWPVQHSVYVYTGGGVTAMTVTDTVAKQRYYPLQIGGSCLCYKGTSHNDNGQVPAHGSRTVFDMYRTDTVPTTIDVRIAGWSTVKNLAVTKP